MVKFKIVIMIGLAWSAVMAAEYPVDKGAYTVEGNLSFLFVGGDLYFDPDNAYLIDANGSYQRFVLPGLAWGVMLQMEYLKSGDNNVSLLAIGPSLAYYLGGEGAKYYPFIKLFLRMGRIDLQGFFAADDKAIVHEYGGSLGLARLVGKNLAITASVDYVHGHYDYDEAEDIFEENQLRFALGMGLFMY